MPDSKITYCNHWLHTGTPTTASSEDGEDWFNDDSDDFFDAVPLPDPTEAELLPEEVEAPPADPSVTESTTALKPTEAPAVAAPAAAASSGEALPHSPPPSRPDVAPAPADGKGPIASPPGEVLEEGVPIALQPGPPEEGLALLSLS